MPSSRERKREQEGGHSRGEDFLNNFLPLGGGLKVGVAVKTLHLFTLTHSPLPSREREKRKERGR